MNRHFFAGLMLVAAAALGTSARGQTLHVVTEATNYSFLRGSRVAGPATEIVEAALRHAAIDDYRITLYPWARAYDLALKEPNAFIYLIARTPTRESQFKWVGEFMRMEYHLYKLKSRQDVRVARPEDARNYAVGVIRDDVRHQYLQSRGFTKLVVSAQNIDAFRQLLSGQVQLVPMPEADAHALCQEVPFDCSALEKVLTLDELTTGLYLAASLTTPDATIDRVRAGFEKVKADGTVRRLMAAKR